MESETAGAVAALCPGAERRDPCLGPLDPAWALAGEGFEERVSPTDLAIDICRPWWSGRSARELYPSGTLRTLLMRLRSSP